MDKIRVAIVTISDRSFIGQREDLSGPALVDFCHSLGWLVEERIVVSDDFVLIQNTLLRLVKSPNIDLILTTGGTGVSPRDNTPEATFSVIDKNIPGLAEHMRFSGFKNNVFALISRAVTGLAGTTLVINLPGSPKGALENLESIAATIPHIVLQAKGLQLDKHA